jgi:hypothetical protein
MLGACWRFVCGMLRSRAALVAEKEVLRPPLGSDKVSPARHAGTLVARAAVDCWRAGDVDGASGGDVDPAGDGLRWQRLRCRLFWRCTSLMVTFVLLYRS